MTAEEYRDAIAALGLTPKGAARFLGIDEETSREWASAGANGPPEPVSRFLRYLIAAGVTPRQVTETLVKGNEQ